jgi:hypothetical protein
MDLGLKQAICFCNSRRKKIKPENNMRTTKESYSFAVVAKITLKRNGEIK